MTNQPVEMGIQPVEMRNLPVETGNLPVEMRNLPVEMRNLPVGMTNLPVEMANLPVEITNLPVESANLPVEIGNLPVEMAIRPVEMTNLPVEMAIQPVESTNPPVEWGRYLYKSNKFKAAAANQRGSLFFSTNDLFFLSRLFERKECPDYFSIGFETFFSLHHQSFGNKFLYIIIYGFWVCPGIRFGNSG